ncbi:LicD family protein [Kocuria rosea]|uniref:LicD/FKTN/FKRP nucleotidyltransferase domain-containing protein n=1 Tax=Kocuria rosea subsp. polaris TaxID=136273 RepID=A0A0A6YCJ3_KOCRO|nr:LicD family protein [Kocuria polaris]KHD97537.1 hypothetical protein GY22_09420 [Kocuria polaris]
MTATPSTGLTDDQLHELHRVQLHIAQQVKQVCDDHGLEYFLIAGTLLGAVRHGGFIPWDDDMDLGMPRDSYDRFLRIAPQELGPNFFVQTLETDPGYGQIFAKVRLEGTELVEVSATGTSAHNGIFVDIFPFDNMPEQVWKQRLHAALTAGLRRVLLLNRGYALWLESTGVRALIFRVVAPAARLLPRNALACLLDRTMRMFGGTPTRAMTALGGSYEYTRESVEREWTHHLEEIEFEGTTFTSLRRSAEYLTKLYGDYMTPPPPERRVTKHGVRGVNFGNAPH